jgi:hypothetical protein
VAESSEGAGAYRKIADLMRAAVIALSVPRPTLTRASGATASTNGTELVKRAHTRADRSPELPRGHAKA